MRVNYSSPNAAANARIQLHQTHFGETNINCYFAQPVTPIGLYINDLYYKSNLTDYKNNIFYRCRRSTSSTTSTY